MYSTLFLTGGKIVKFWINLHKRCDGAPKSYVVLNPADLILSTIFLLILICEKKMQVYNWWGDIHSDNITLTMKTTMMTNGNNDTNAADDDVKNKSGLVFQCFSGADFFFFFFFAAAFPFSKQVLMNTLPKTQTL